MCSYARLYIDKSYPSLSLYLYVELKSFQFSGNALKKSNCNFWDCGFCNNALYALFSLAVSMGKYCAVIVERNVANSNSVRKKRFIRFIVSKNIITRSLRLFLFHYVRSCQKNQKVLLFLAFVVEHSLHYRPHTLLLSQRYLAFSGRCYKIHSECLNISAVRRIYKTKKPMSIVIGVNLFMFHFILQKRGG